MTLPNPKTDMSNLATYEAGLLQARAYRTLNRAFSAYLASVSLSLSEWALLGLLRIHGRMTHVELASELDVTPTMATKLVTRLEASGYLDRVADSGDNRVKFVEIAAAGNKLIDQIEPHLRRRMARLMSGVEQPNLVAYLGVLAYLADSSNET